MLASARVKRLCQVTTSYFCCGIEVEDGVVVAAAPIMKWAVGKSDTAVREWVRKKKGTMEAVEW